MTQVEIPSDFQAPDMDGGKCAGHARGVRFGGVSAYAENGAAKAASPRPNPPPHHAIIPECQLPVSTHLVVPFSTSTSAKKAAAMPGVVDVEPAETRLAFDKIVDAEMADEASRPTAEGTIRSVSHETLKKVSLAARYGMPLPEILDTAPAPPGARHVKPPHKQPMARRPAP